ncbi:MAG: GNAT family N-acetyltransferase [Desulfobacterales bacterium]|nr:MAG: GNAT family N-acetyltransferase [Desulfobacterales bacterium]
MSGDFWTIRNFQPSDFEDYLRLLLESEMQNQSGRHVSRSLLADALEHPRYHPENDLFLAQGDKRIIGFISVFREPGIGRGLLDGLVHPLHRRKGVATELFDHAVRHAKAAGCSRVQICIAENNLGARQLFARLGLRFIRHFFGYRMDLTAVQLPEIKMDDYVFRSLRPGEEDQLTAIQNRAFTGTWGFNPNTRDEIFHRIHSNSCSPENVIMVYQKDKPVAYCWTRIFHEEHSGRGASKGEIHMLGVDPDYRNQSIGKNVLAAGLSYLKQRGINRVELTADSQEKAALALYESAGFEKYKQIEWYEKSLS